MNKFALLPLFLLLFFSAKAQDKIISIKHDTIHCAIVSISNERIFYELKNNDGSVAGKSMPLSQVAEYSTSHQPEKKSKMGKQEIPKSGYIPENPLCLGLNVGCSTMPWYLDNFQPSSALPDYYNKLKTGIHINASAHYMVKGFLGLGVEYSFFRTSTSGSIPSVSYSSIFIVGSEKYHLYVNYFGASVLFQQHLDAQRKFIISESLSAGVLFLRLEYQNTYPSVTQSGYSDISNNMLLTGNSFGGKLGLTAEYRLFRAVSVGLGGNFIWCSLKKASFKSKGSNNNNYSSNDQELSNAMKLSRIDYSFVLHYYF
jgi:hypothetical protein